MTRLDDVDFRRFIRQHFEMIRLLIAAFVSFGIRELNPILGLFAGFEAASPLPVLARRQIEAGQ